MQYIHSYIRNKQQRRVGIVLAAKVDTTVFITWSKLNKVDKFDRQIGLGQALLNVNKPVPPTIYKYIEPMEARARKYFKDAHKFVLPAKQNHSHVNKA